MESLPIELKALILRSVSDFVGLSSLIRTFRSMYKAFNGSKPSILASTLRLSLPTELLREVLAVECTAQFKIRDMDFTELPINLWPYNPLCKHYSYPLPTTGAFDKLVRVHLAVEWLTNDLCQDFSKVDGSLDFTTLPLLQTEEVRIHRAFYRLQILCNLYQTNTTNMKWASVRHQFLDDFSLWEVEELACVCKYLQQKLESSFNAPWDHLPLTCGCSPYLAQNLWISQGVVFLDRLFSTNLRFDDPEKINSSIWIPNTRTRMIGRAPWRLYVSQRYNEPPPGPEDTTGDMKTLTRPTARWLLEWYRNSGRVVPHRRLPSYWSEGYCFWSSARLSSSVLVKMLMANARERR